MQRGFFKNGTGDLLAALGFLGGLYNFVNFVIILDINFSWTASYEITLVSFNVSLDDM